MPPGNAYALLKETAGSCALLESTLSAGGLGRISLLARNPRAVLVADRRSVRVTTKDGSREVGRDPMAALRDLLRQIAPGAWPREGGVVGALAYDFARPQRDREPTPLLVALAVDRFDVFEASAGVAPAPLDPRPAPRLDLASISSLSAEEHRRLVLRVKDHVAAGDVYQANLSQRFRLPWPQGGLALYDRLRRVSPAPFSGYLRAAGIEIVSASPERLLKVENGTISTRPIAGTRPRSRDALEDEALAEELLLSEKERAEHLMLLDLARNDLGRVAAIGSVTVDEMMTVETYAQVRHIVSNVRARLAPGSDALDALLALFPGGTITGVPKARCMEILDELEPVARGFYTGSLFYVTPSGRLDANILIRSAVVAGGTVTFHTGGGIVADSDPAFEYAETLHKAEGMKTALEAVLAEPSSALSGLDA
jgi:anthranilate/para-aminobenzoate synthase component I